MNSTDDMTAQTIVTDMSDPVGVNACQITRIRRHGAHLHSFRPISCNKCKNIQLAYALCMCGVIISGDVFGLGLCIS